MSDCRRPDNASEFCDTDLEARLKGANNNAEYGFKTCALYKFVTLEHFSALRQPLLQKMSECDVYGTVLLAHEGINGTVSADPKALQDFLEWICAMPEFADMEFKYSYHNEIPFYRRKVKLKREIVTMGVEDIDPRHSVGTYVAPENWNDLIRDPDVLVVDTRNDYEVEIGSFEGAIAPGTKNFREFPTWAKANLNVRENTKIAMFCTGGIRCEKSTAYLKFQGFEEVYHLHGGILNYLHKVPQPQSLWQGECFVFDNRVAVDHDLKSGSYDQCHACRMPITKEQKDLPSYSLGESCLHCFDKRDERQKQRSSQRQKQIVLAESRGEAHMGDAGREVTERRRVLKRARREPSSEGR